MSYSHLLVGATARPVRLEVRHITPSDLWQALAEGFSDFAAIPSHAIFLCVIYPLLGLWLISLASGYSAVPLAFPLAAVFALIGPFAAVGLYELSRRAKPGSTSASITPSTWCVRRRSAPSSFSAFC